MELEIQCIERMLHDHKVYQTAQAKEELITVTT